MHLLQNTFDRFVPLELGHVSERVKEKAIQGVQIGYRYNIFLMRSEKARFDDKIWLQGHLHNWLFRRRVHRCSDWKVGSGALHDVRSMCYWRDRP